MKAVIFDFDGTLTEKRGNLWKKIWSELGYDVGPDSYYTSLLKRFLNGELSHADWCVLTLKAYQDKGLTKEKFYDIMADMKLMVGAEELFQYLSSKNIELHIVSGNIVTAIEKVLGENKRYFTDIKANDFVFDEKGNITNIIGTKYDHKGKAEYIKEICKAKGYKTSDVLFIGNSLNDEWVYTSGAKTLCINPDNAKSENKEIWNKVIYTDNLFDLKNIITNEEF